jgi:broad specificity phosphatase PhoE
MRRAKHTAELIGAAINTPVLSVKTLDELDYGAADGLTYMEIGHKYPEKIKEREKDKLRFRFPRGESYLDVISRIEPVIFEIERYRRPVVIVAHTDTIRYPSLLIILDVCTATFTTTKLRKYPS